MSQVWATIFVSLCGAWAGAVLYGMLLLRGLIKRFGREQAWPAVHRVIPFIDLLGTWIGTAGVVALAMGRQGYTLAWALCLGLFAVMITASLYDRAVLMPSLDAAFQRVGKGDDPAKWERDWRFLWRMSGLGRLLVLALALTSLLLALLRFFA